MNLFFVCISLIYDIIVENSDESYNLKFLHIVFIMKNMTYFHIVFLF